MAGFEEEKQKLTEAIHDPVMYPLAYDLAVQPVRTVLMFGPPGTGKTLLARAIAGEIGAVLFNIASADLLSKWQGDSEKAVRSLFDAALNQDKPAVIFMDEIDSLCRIRTTEENDSTRRIKTELMTQMQRIDESCKAAQMSGKPLKYVCFLGATNCPWDIDS